MLTNEVYKIRSPKNFQIVYDFLTEMNFKATGKKGP